MSDVHYGTHSRSACRLFSMFLGMMVAALVVGWHVPGTAGDAWANRQDDTTMVLYKAKQLLALYRNGTKVRQYRVCLGLNPHGPKRTLGDYRTPEGDYYICSKNTSSQFHRFLGISYPGEKDAQFAFERGMISKDKRDSILARIKTSGAYPWDTELGGWVGIHGYPSDAYRGLWIALFYPKPHNWTDGCIAMWNYEIEDLFAQVNIGTPIKILP
ncbi:MAG: L,D-transpeptidase family protein [Desulfomonile tiedjei]|nr:L,D-transpeptidase family protein [Desulfomonile tiedjei]